MRGNWRLRAAERSHGFPGAPAHFTVVEPGTTTLRLLVAEAAGDQATVWGWAEGPGPEVQELAAACRTALAQAEEMARDLMERWILADQILIGLPASQLRGRAWSITQQRSLPDRPVEERELEALLGRALRLAVNELRSAGPDDAGWLLVDAAPVAMTVDGRGVTDPVGFRGREIGAMVFAALARAEVIESWREVARELEFSALMLMAAPVALTAGLSTMQGMLVDVGGAATDLTWCRAGRPVALESLPKGGTVLTSSLARQWNLSPERAERLKRAYSGGRLAEEGKVQVQAVLAPVLRTWTEEMETALALLNREEPLPQQIYLLGGGSALPGMVEALRPLAWSERLRFARYPQVSRVRPTDVQGVVNRTDKGHGPGDVPALALAAWTAHQNQLPGRPWRILSELCQMHAIES
jgi:cell division protein FtsA